MPTRRRVVMLVLALTGAVLASFSAARASVPDPSSNFWANPACGTTASCLAAATSVLDQARARLGEPTYRLPANFSALGPDEQAFVLTDLDRTLYGLAPIPGLTAQLDQAAATAVRLDTDPSIGAPAITTVAADWAGGYRDLPLAYEAWMYNDGPGGADIDCTSLNRSGCWAHRHNVLWTFTGTGPLAMGAAAGPDPRGMSGYALLIVQGNSGYHPDYLYTWSQALAAGARPAGPAPAQPSSANVAQARLTIRRLRIRRRAVFFRVTGPPGVPLACSMTPTHALRSRAFRRCGPEVAYRDLRPGAYRLRLRAGGRLVRRAIRIPAG